MWYLVITAQKKSGPGRPRNEWNQTFKGRHTSKANAVAALSGYRKAWKVRNILLTNVEEVYDNA